MPWPHGFHVRHVNLAPSANSILHTRNQPEVLLIHRGVVTIELPDGELTVKQGDTLTIPIGMPRRFSNRTALEAEWFVVRGTDQPDAAVPADGTSNTA